MTVVRALDHLALRVADVDRAARFYVDAFDLRWLAQPFEEEGADLEYVLHGPAGVRWRVAFLEFPTGGGIELIEFTSPRIATGAEHITEGGILHFGVQVEDVREAVARVEAAGGRRLWAEPLDIGHGNLEWWVQDPDGHTIQLHDTTFHVVVDSAASFSFAPGVAPRIEQKPLE